MNYIIEYNEKIQSGEIVACNKIKAIYSKLAEETLKGKNNWIYDNERSLNVIEFIETFCKHSKGKTARQNIKLELFQKAFISALFGFVDKDTGLRRYKETFFLVARKNGKSCMLSTILLYMMIADNEGGAEVYTIASKKDQARITFSEAHNMVSQSKHLGKIIKKRKTDLYCNANFSKMEALASESNTLDGLNSHCVVIDELHTIEDQGLYEVMKQSMSARSQPLMVLITTAGTVRENIFDTMYEYASNIVNGSITDERFLPILYELDKKEEWTDPNMWQKANPGLGTIKYLDDITEKVERCKQDKRFLTGVLCKDFNVRENTSQAWLSFHDVNNEETFDLENFRNSYCIGGVDLSSTTDLTCATLLFMKRGCDTKYISQMYFLPDSLLQKRVNEDKIRYDIWRDQGLLRTSYGTKINYSDVVAWFEEMKNKYQLFPLWIGYDSWSAQYFTEEMRRLGYNMKEVRQGAKTFSTPMKLLESDLTEKKINYNNNNLLKWCLTNTCIEADKNENIRPVKGKSAKRRIDGAVSLLDAYVVLYENKENFQNML